MLGADSIGVGVGDGDVVSGNNAGAGFAGNGAGAGFAGNGAAAGKSCVLTSSLHHLSSCGFNLSASSAAGEGEKMTISIQLIGSMNLKTITKQQNGFSSLPNKQTGVTAGKNA